MIYLPIRYQYCKELLIGELLFAGGSVVTKSAPPRSIIGGVPGKILKYRWDIDSIIKHEIILYDPKDRINKEDLIRLLNNNFAKE